MFGRDDEGERERDREIDRILGKYEEDFVSTDTEPRGRVESREYQEYKRAERAHGRKNWYERLVGRVSFFRFSFDDLVKEHEQTLRLLHYDVEPDQIAPAALIVAGLLELAALTTFMLSMPFLFRMFFVLIPFAVFMYLVKYPWLKAQQKIIGSSEDLILAILYMVVYMRSSPNLEGAVSFAARHLEGPIAEDFKLLLWKLDVREYGTVTEGLDDYIDRWRPFNSGFVESLDLIISATLESNADRRNDILTEAINNLLTFTKDQMYDFAQALKLPVMALHGLGILLPVLGIILFPMVAAFMGGGGMIYYLAFLYNIVIPLIAFTLMENLMVNRPISFSSQAGRLDEGPGAFIEFTVFGRTIGIGAYALTIPLFLLLLAVSANHFLNALYGVGITAVPDPGAGIPPAPGASSLFQEMLLVLAPGFALGMHLILKSKRFVARQADTRKLEEEFPQALFELGKALDRGHPVEVAVADLGQEGDRLEIAFMFRAIAENINEAGMTFREAVFDAQRGAIWLYPSKMLATVLEIVSEATQKGTHVAATALESISQYLKNIQDTQQKLEELLEETTSSLIFLGYVMAPVVAGIAVGLGSVISTAFYQIGQVFGETGNVSPGAGAGGGAGEAAPTVFTVFSVESAIPPGLLSLVVGLYLVQIVILIGTMFVRLTEGNNPHKRNVLIGKMLISALTFYTLVVLIIHTIFGNIIIGGIG